MRNQPTIPGSSSPACLRQRRRGVSAMLAMLYVILFSTLSVGFFSAFTLATQTSYNDREAGRALAAAESGMEFVRYELWSLNIPHDTPANELFDNVYAQLSARLDGSANLDGGSIARDGDTILIPGDPDKYIDLKGEGEGAGFRVTLARDGNELLVSTSGRVGSATSGLGRAIHLRYGIFERPAAIFDFGVASRSSITMDGNTAILGTPDPASGSVLSTATLAYPLVMGNDSEISGEVAFSNPDGWVKSEPNSVINNEVGEANWADNIHHVSEPDFPVVNTNDYLPYATNAITSNTPTGTSFTNIIIPPNTNPTFAGGTEIWGVIYIQSPNVVKFAGNSTIHGIIVTENDSTGSWSSNNRIEFRGTVDADGMASLPDKPEFAGLKEMGGAFILAENFAVDFGGTAKAGSTTVAGSIVASSVSFTGTADALVDGSIINLESTSSVYFSGNGTVTVKSSGTKEQPHGLYFGSRYVPLPGSYQEVLP